ncbi:MAG: hypothetical protein ACD_79C00277G0001, partial [uncultured bacterium]
MNKSRYNIFQRIISLLIIITFASNSVFGQSFINVPAKPQTVKEIEAIEKGTSGIVFDANGKR